MHTTRDIWFHSGPRLKLSGRLYLPDPSNDLRAGAVFCLGFGGVQGALAVENRAAFFASGQGRQAAQLAAQCVD